LSIPRTSAPLASSWAAWRALIQLIRNPFYWEKTSHGLSTATPHPGLPMTGAGSEQQAAGSEG